MLIIKPNIVSQSNNIHPHQNGIYDIMCLGDRDAVRKTNIY